MSSEHDLWYLCTELTEIWDFWNLPHTVIISHKTVKWAQNTNCETCPLNSRIHEIFVNFTSYSYKKQENGQMSWEHTNCDTFALKSRRYEIFEVFPHKVVRSRKTVKWAEKYDLWYFCTELPEIWDFWSFSSYSCKKPYNGQMGAEKTICDTCAVNSRRYKIFEVFPHTVVISRITVKSAQNTICDTCAVNSRRYKIFEVFRHTVVISRKTVKWAQNTICDTCAVNLLRYKIFEVFLHFVIKTVKQSNELRTRFVILVHLTHGDMRSLKIYLIQLE